MPSGRQVLMCGPVRASPGGRVEKIVAAGGYANGIGYLNTVDIYDITGNTWASGNSLPAAIYSAATIEHSNSFLMMGGYDGTNRRHIATVYSYKSENGGKWVQEPFKMAEAKNHFVAMRVNPSIFNSC